MQRFVYIFTYYEIIKILKVGSFTPFLAPAWWIILIVAVRSLYFTPATGFVSLENKVCEGITRLLHGVIFFIDMWALHNFSLTSCINYTAVFGVLFQTAEDALLLCSADTHRSLQISFTCTKSKVFPNNRGWSAWSDKLFDFCCARHLNLIVYLS